MEKKIPLKRTIIAGFFMGLANLVPGVSGGTMVLALGLYDKFIQSFSDLTRFKFTKDSIIFVGMLFGLSALTIMLLSSPIQYLMEHYRWAMMASFIGLTLGGVPVLSKEVDFKSVSNHTFILSGFIFMAFIALVLKPGAIDVSWFFLFIGGIIGSSAMILPGISGSYLLLVMGLYLPIISAINEFKGGLKALNFLEVWSVGFDVILPVALGMAAGMIALSNVLKMLLEKKRTQTESFLLGLLIGSVLGLYPFQGANFDKIVKHAVVKGDQSIVKVIGVGFDHTQNQKLVSNIKKVETKKIKVEFLNSKIDGVVTNDLVDLAKKENAVIIGFSTFADSQVRKYAKKNGKIYIQSVSDTSESIPRVLLSILLAVLGFLLTFFLSKMRSSK